MTTNKTRKKSGKWIFVKATKFFIFFSIDFSRESKGKFINSSLEKQVGK
jgi:hypothetical protein